MKNVFMLFSHNYENWKLSPTEFIFRSKCIQNEAEELHKRKPKINHSFGNFYEAYFDTFYMFIKMRWKCFSIFISRKLLRLSRLNLNNTFCPPHERCQTPVSFWRKKWKYWTEKECVFSSVFHLHYIWNYLCVMAKNFFWDVYYIQGVFKLMVQILRGCRTHQNKQNLQ